jgi:hypothetical protein
VRYKSLAKRVEALVPSTKPLEFIFLDEGDPMPELVDPEKEYFICQAVYED